MNMVKYIDWTRLYEYFFVGNEMSELIVFVDGGVMLID